MGRPKRTTQPQTAVGTAPTYLKRKCRPSAPSTVSYTQLKDIYATLDGGENKFSKIQEPDIAGCNEGLVPGFQMIYKDFELRV